MAAAGPAAPPAPASPGNHQLLQAGACRVGHATEGAAPHSACETLAQYIDHTLLKPTATDAQVAEICKQARDYHFASVCINPAYIPLAASILAGSGVMVCTVIGFPLGSTSTETKAFETRDAVAKGADEIDMVIHIGKLKSGDFEYVCNDIRAVVQSAQGRTVKVIIETSLLTDDEKVAACILSKAAGAHFVKTSTGFGGGGATPEDIALMRRIVGKDLGVKASGGVKDCASAEKLIAAGASRLGASASVEIVEGKTGKGSY
ncbi:deoxyribose-phosphate aldolase [bacterium]|nr:deoxyribose-phosphate aldolase [bacterium]